MPWFNEANHTYWDDQGNRLLSNTEILDLASLVDKRFFNDQARQRGTDLHAASVLIEDGDLCWEDAWKAGIEGECKAWAKFLSDTQFSSILREKPLFSRFGFAGTVDRVGKIVHRGKTVWVIIDIKTGVEYPWHPIQLAGYDILLDGVEGIPVVRRRLGVYLSSEGTYTMKPYTDPSDRALFLSALNIARWKLNNLQGETR